MVKIVLIGLLAIPFYLLPGFLSIWLFDIRNMKLWDRLFFSLCISLVEVPTLFILVGNILHFIPDLTAYSILVIILLALGLFLRGIKRRPVIQLPQPPSTSSFEKIGVWVFIFVFSAIANLSRIAMFVQGTQTLDIGTYDESWHLSELVSVARTGIPPMHYFFPGIKLVYYYSSWIYPAIMGNLPVFHISLARALSIQSYIIIFSFLGLAYYLILFNFRKWWVRLLGVGFFTIMNGFGLYANAPSILGPETWQSFAGWLIYSLPVLPLSSQYAWAPQHVAGGIAFLFGLLIWKNISASPFIKSVLTGILLSFCLTTSFFVFFSSVLVIILVLILNARQLWMDRKKTLWHLTSMGVVFLLISWSTVLSYASHGSGFKINNFRIAVIEMLRGGAAGSALVDRALMILGFPLVMAWIGVISLGLSFLLYLVWLLTSLFSEKKAPHRNDMLLMFFFPAVYFFLNILISDTNGGGGLAIRGMIPTLVFIAFGALLFLENLSVSLFHPGWRKWLSIYLVVCFLIAESLSTYAQIRWVAVTAVKSVIAVNIRTSKPSNWQLDESKPWTLPSSLSYIPWLNINTPTRALIIEDGCPIDMADQFRYHWLERVRFLNPECANFMSFFGHDMELVSPSEWSSLVDLAKNYPDLLDLFHATIDADKYNSVFYIDRSHQADNGWGNPVYEDDFVRIFRIK